MKDAQPTLFDMPPIDGSVIKFPRIRYPIWTDKKALLIARYMYYFLLITRHGVYIDGFAGPQQPSLPDTWAARAVLGIKPEWLRHVSLCEINQKRHCALHALLEEYKGPASTTLYCGDFNDVVQKILGSGVVRDRVATFCLLDQQTFECDWETVATLARHKSASKIELFYFVPTGWIGRAIAGLRDRSTLERWWGRGDWKTIKKLGTKELADLFCQRFRDELGYAHAYAFPIYDRTTGGGRRVMYHMVHATDHHLAPGLMVRAYRNATGAREEPEQFILEFKEWQGLKGSDA